MDNWSIGSGLFMAYRVAHSSFINFHDATLSGCRVCPGYDPRMIRALIIFLIPFLVALPVHAVGPDHDKAVYLVSFDLPHLPPGSKLDRATIRALRGMQDEQLGRAEQVLGRTLRPSHRYFASHNGVAVSLTPLEARQLAGQAGVRDIRREQIYRLATWNSPGFVGADAVWSGAATPDGQALRGEGRVAAILDTGLPANPHPSFADDPACGHGVTQPAKVLSAVDCATTDEAGACNGPDPFDRHGHGSHVAAIMAGNRIDRSAVPAPPIPASYTFMSGVAPCASIRSYKVCPTDFCPQSQLLAGLNQVLLDGDADVLNFSISGGRDPWRDNDRVKLDLVAAGIVVVAAAGNTGGGISNPVGQVNHLGPWVLSVAASSRDATATGVPAQGDVLAAFSLRGPTPAPLANLQKPDLTAPGIDIRSAWPDGYALRSGTSMASPHVAGAAVLVRQAHPDWTAMEVKSALRMSASNTGTAPDGETPWHPDQVGSGRLDLERVTRAGLVLDEQPGSFLAARPELGGDIRSLNLPALRDLDCTPRCDWTRLVRNTLSEASQWQVVVSAPEDLAVTVSPDQFTFDGDTEAQLALAIRATPLADLDDGIHFAEIRLVEASGQSPDLRLTLAVKGRAGAELAVDPESIAIRLEPGQLVEAPLQLANPGAFDLNWSARTLAAVAAAGAEKEKLEIPAFSLAGGGPAQVHAFDFGPDRPGRVVGLNFRGRVAVEAPSWASDLKMVLTSPDGERFAVGGFDNLSRPWSFQGMQSALSDVYASVHDQPFGTQGVPLAGKWQLTFSNDFLDGGRMDWREVEVTLAVDQARCEPEIPSSWLTASPAQGRIAAGGGSEMRVIVDGDGLPLGHHESTLCLDSNAIKASQRAVPVRVDVFPPAGPDQALVNGQVSSQGICDGEQAPLLGAELAVAGFGQTVRSAPGGYFQLPAAAGQSGQVLTVSAPGHLSVSLELPELAAGSVHELAVDLRLDQACALLEPIDPALVIESGEQASLDLALSNAGAAPLDWRLTAGAGLNCEQSPPDWLDGLPAGAVLGADDTQTLSVTVNGAGMAPGRYSTRLCLFEADAGQALQVVELDLEVTATAYTWTIAGSADSPGYCGQDPVLPPGMVVTLSDTDGQVREKIPGASGHFRFGADTRFQPYALTASAPGYQAISLTDLVAEAGEQLDLHLGLALDQPCARAGLDEQQPMLESGQATVLTLDLDNQAGAAGLDWQLSFAQALPQALPDGTRPHDPALDEVLDLPTATLMPPGSAGSSLAVVREAGLQSQGRVIGLTFSGQVEGISDHAGRASDLQLEVIGPVSGAQTMGGFSGLVLPWAFQGPVSDLDGVYQSTHWLDAGGQPLFGEEGVIDGGAWQLRLAHDWHSSQAGPMHWQAIEVTLHKMAEAGCRHPAPVDWLAVASSDQAGVLGPGQAVQIPIAVSAEALPPGQYRALVCLATSDPQTGRIGLEIELNVKPIVTRVFTDRFETVK
ncbi:MAG: hypothetical protein EA370_07010 [Wenzhouxiangella sp.]|nr:MAG: hypothetical protein EA370_07010 [Wenzhouxiangella sp.]